MNPQCQQLFQNLISQMLTNLIGNCAKSVNRAVEEANVRLESQSEAAG